MASDLIRYDILTQDALRQVIRKVIGEVAQTGLPGEHHFFVTFETRHPGVRISSRLRAQYPEEMTIVLQHQFWDLNVTETTFEVGLSFNGVPERLLVPFRAIKAFVDPHASFGLKFDVPETEGENLAAAEAEAMPGLLPGEEEQPGLMPSPLPPAVMERKEGSAETAEASAEGEDGKEGAEVVSLDAFRKKNG